MRPRMGRKRFRGLNMKCAPGSSVHVLKNERGNEVKVTFRRKISIGEMARGKLKRPGAGSFRSKGKLVRRLSLSLPEAAALFVLFAKVLPLKWSDLAKK